MRRNNVKLSDAASVMTRYPQFIVNIKTIAEGKLAFFTDAEVKAILEEAKAAIGEGGRIVTRPSGTEPLIRVMTEGDDSELAKRIAEETAERIKAQLDTYN